MGYKPIGPPALPYDHEHFSHVLRAANIQSQWRKEAAFNLVISGIFVFGIIAIIIALVV